MVRFRYQIRWLEIEIPLFYRENLNIQKKTFLYQSPYILFLVRTTYYT